MQHDEAAQSDEVDRVIGEKLAMVRKLRALQIGEVAKALSICPTELVMFETGMKRVPPARLLAAAEFYDVSINWFLDGAPEIALDTHGKTAAHLLAHFLALPGALDLMQSFIAIKCDEKRLRVVEMAKGLAAHTREISKQYWQ